MYPALLPAAAMQVAAIAVGRAKSNERPAAWTTPARPPHISPPSRRRWYEEIPRKRRSMWCCAQPSSRKSKNAWKVKDFAHDRSGDAEGPGRGLAALHLDPRNTDARLKVAGLQDKMVGLVSERPSPR